MEEKEGKEGLWHHGEMVQEKRRAEGDGEGRRNKWGEGQGGEKMSGSAPDFSDSGDG